MKQKKILASSNPAPKIEWADSAVHEKSSLSSASTISTRSLSEEDLSISISKGQKLIQCRLSSEKWTLDELAEDKRSSELYFDWPKWERKRLYKPDLNEAFDFTVLLSGQLIVEIEQVPKTTSGVAIVTQDTLHATSGSRYLVGQDSIKTANGQFTVDQNSEEQKLQVKVEKFGKTGEFGFFVEFFDENGVLGESNVFHYSGRDKNPLF